MGVIQRLKGGEEQFVRATRTVWPGNLNALSPLFYRGQILAAGNSYTKRYGDCFEPVELVTRGPSPGPNEPVAISRAWFKAYDGQDVFPRQRFQLHDRIVLEHPGAFFIERTAD